MYIATSFSYRLYFYENGRGKVSLVKVLIRNKVMIWRGGDVASGCSKMPNSK